MKHRGSFQQRNVLLDLVLITAHNKFLEKKHHRTTLLEGNETRRVSGTNTGTSVLDGLVGDGELSEVVTDHLGLNFDLVENLAVVNSNNAANHLGNNDHISKVSLDSGGLLAGNTLLLTINMVEIM